MFNFFAIDLLFYISRILNFHFSEDAKEKKIFWKLQECPEGAICMLLCTF